jgi:Short C-terminal domain
MALTGMHPRTVGRSTPASGYLFTALAIGGVWLSVVLASIFAPAMVTGTQHDRLPIAGFEDWVFGAVATGAVIQAAMEGLHAGVSARPLWLVLGITVATVWVGVLLVSVFTPDFVTGTDPTRLPFAAMLSPIAGSVLTGVVCGVVKAGFRRPQPAEDESTTLGVRTAAALSQQAAADDAAAKLGQLPALRATGAITDEEFEAKKRELLSRI